MTYQDIIKDKPKNLIGIANQLRKMAFQLHPAITENAYGGKAVQMTLYSIGNPHNPILGIALGKDHCKLFLHHWDKVDCGTIRLTGKGKHSRHVKYYALEELDEALPKILEAITQIALARI